jgi:serine protease Do
MGSPLALSQSITMGIVSNTELIIPSFWREEMTLDGEDVGSMVRWIGHDAQIEHGNSGGPLVNLKGQVIGINEINIGLAGAIPSNVAKVVAAEIIKSGKVSRSWIGVNVQSMLKSSLLKKGVLVGGVIPGGPADTAGLKVGDIITKVADKDVSARFAEEMPIFNQTVAALPVGKESNMTVIRDGKEIVLKITPQERPEAEPRPREFKQWGMCVSNLSFVKARSMKRSSQDGVTQIEEHDENTQAEQSINDRWDACQIDDRHADRLGGAVIWGVFG